MNMKANLSVPMLPHDTDSIASLVPRTMVDVNIHDQAIEIFFNEDLDQDMGPTYARSVVVEFDENNWVQVRVYPFDQEEPVSVKIGLTGEYLVETP